MNFPLPPGFLPPRREGGCPRLGWGTWFGLVLLPRVGGPLVIVALLFTTRGQFLAIQRDELLWLNIPIMGLGVGSIALNSRMLFVSWRDWTWHGELRRIVRELRRLK